MAASSTSEFAPRSKTRAGERILELHLFDFDQQIYGEDVEVAFVQYLRPEQKFSGVDELQAQIRRDAELARQIYHSPEKEVG